MKIHEYRVTCTEGGKVVSTRVDTLEFDSALSPLQVRQKLEEKYQVEAELRHCELEVEPVSDLLCPDYIGALRFVSRDASNL